MTDYNTYGVTYKADLPAEWSAQDADVDEVNFVDVNAILIEQGLQSKT